MWSLKISCVLDSLIYLKEALYGFPLAYLICHHYYSCTSRPFSSKLRVSWTQAPWYLDKLMWSPIWLGSDSGRGINAAWRCWTKGWSMARVGQSGTSRDFFRLLRMECNLQLINCLFLKFSIRYFRATVDCGETETEESETMDKGGLLYLRKISMSYIILTIFFKLTFPL